MSATWTLIDQNTGRTLTINEHLDHHSNCLRQYPLMIKTFKEYMKLKEAVQRSPERAKAFIDKAVSRKKLGLHQGKIEGHPRQISPLIKSNPDYDYGIDNDYDDHQEEIPIKKQG